MSLRITTARHSRLWGALFVALLVGGAATEAHADRNRYTKLQPGQRYAYYPYYYRHRYFGPPVIPYGYEEERPVYGYGYGGYGYGPRYGGYYEPY